MLKCQQLVFFFNIYEHDKFDIYEHAHRVHANFVFVHVKQFKPILLLRLRIEGIYSFGTWMNAQAEIGVLPH